MRVLHKALLVELQSRASPGPSLSAVTLPPLLDPSWTSLAPAPSPPGAPAGPVCPCSPDVVGHQGVVWGALPLLHHKRLDRRVGQQQCRVKGAQDEPHKRLQHHTTTAATIAAVSAATIAAAAAVIAAAVAAVSCECLVVALVVHVLAAGARLKHRVAVVPGGGGWQTDRWCVTEFDVFEMHSDKRCSGMQQLRVWVGGVWVGGWGGGLMT